MELGFDTATANQDRLRDFSLIGRPQAGSEFLQKGGWSKPDVARSFLLASHNVLAWNIPPWIHLATIMR